MQDIFRRAVDDGVAGVIAALAADDDVRFSGEDVDDFAFAFIAPLRADQYRICHRVALGRQPLQTGTEALRPLRTNDRVTARRRKPVLF